MIRKHILQISLTVLIFIIKTRHVVAQTTDLMPTYENASCWFTETDSDYQNFIFVYKDNVQTASECCQFCNSNSRCRVWSLQSEIGRCYLKFDRGARVYNHGFVSGFSNSCMSKTYFLRCEK